MDETWLKTNMARLYGRSPRGQRLPARVPHGHWHTTTFLAGLRHDRVVAPLMLPGAMDGAAFRKWAEQFLAPTLEPGDIVIADNLSSHKVAGVREAIEARGATLLFLPSYSPDLNPIEQLFPKIKSTVRRLAPRTLEALHEAVAHALAHVVPSECSNMIAAAGYGQSG